MKKPDKNKFSRSDWVVVIIIGILVLVGLGVAIFFGVKALIEGEIDKLSNTETSLTGEIVRSSEVLDLYVNKKSGLLIFSDNQCLLDEMCTNYLSEVFMLATVSKAGSPEVYAINRDVSLASQDSNLEVTLARAKVEVFPTVILLRDGLEVARYSGYQEENEGIYELFVNNNLLDEETLNELMAEEGTTETTTGTEEL